MNPENRIVCDGERKQPLHCEIIQNYKFEVQVEFEVKEERVKVTWEDIKLKVNANSKYSNRNCKDGLVKVKLLLRFIYIMSRYYVVCLVPWNSTVY